ncbi:hypothetical protein KGQ19_19300 [Catenulispora sp. NL8]|uniref:Uncharacterized protein n=1 Tax=Catenulispora pinistramenti TaxID=2705254 RepID=A0ABS5KSJ2_9ACTN|nr:hypothetical protein [Catenulispora pinistramenti]MBS2549016.1 hypothetical protein [Catenulispora pinistramenti]
MSGLTDHVANIDGVTAYTASLGNVERVDVLALHKLAIAHNENSTSSTPWLTTRRRPASRSRTPGSGSGRSG